MRPALFVASSTESIRLALGVQANLQKVADVTTWNQDVFSPGSITLDVLIQTAAESDFGVFVFSPDDLVRMRDEVLPAVRDNVLFEFGLFVNQLGRRRVFMLTPENLSAPTRIPPDLLGLTAAVYDAARLDRDPNVQAVLGPACLAIQIAIEREWGELPGLTGDVVLLLRYLDRDHGTWVLPDQLAKFIGVFNGAPEQADPHTGRGWRRAVRYQMLWLDSKGLVESNNITTPIYRISNRGRKLVDSLKSKPAYARIFAEELKPFDTHEWVHATGAISLNQGQLSGNDFRLLFAVYEAPGQKIPEYEDAIVQPAGAPLIERARRLEKIGLLYVFEESKELGLTAKGRELVGTIKTVADQVYRRDQ